MSKDLKDFVVQFNENHEWRGCLGIIEEVKELEDGSTRYMIGVPIPEQGTAYIYVTDTENAIEVIGEAVLIVR